MTSLITRILWIVGSQLLVLIGVWVNRDWVTERPISTTVLVVLYELLLLVVGFGKKVLGEVQQRAVKHVADLIWVQLVTLAPGFAGRYKKHVISEHSVFNVRGLGLINTYTLALEQVFVDLRIAPSQNPRKSSIGLVGIPELTGNHPLWTFLSAEDKASEGRGLAVIGAPGCGKTTLLQHVALIYAGGYARRHNIQSRIPILLFLRDHIAAIVKDKPSLAELAQKHFGDSALFPGVDPPQNWFQQKLAKGKCIVLLDGLDEVADLSQRIAVSEWVDNQIANFPLNRFILTARPQGYVSAPLQRVHVLEVLPFNSSQVQLFINNWYLANEVVSSGYQTTLEVKNRATRDANSLIARLHESRNLEALTTNPLLLTMIAMVHRYHGALPGSRVELYREICEVLLGRWRQTRGVKESLELTAGKKLVVLKPLAAHMMTQELRDISEEDALRVMSEPLKKIGISGKKLEGFLQLLQDSSGLVLERESGNWSFAHLTFQEYLTSEYWLDQKTSEPDWKPMVGSSWWTETLRLYAAQADATTLVKACLEVDTVDALALAVDCLAEAEELDADVREEINERLIDGLESPDAIRRSLAAQVRLSRRLQSLQRIDDYSKIDLEYLTCAEYQLFLDDKEGYGRDRYPDHWLDGNFVIERARTYLEGVHADDAVEFCAWLGYRFGKDFDFRLPTVKEATQYPAQVKRLGTWCKDGAKFEITGFVSAEAENILRWLRASAALQPPNSLSQAQEHSPFDLDHAVDIKANYIYKNATRRHINHSLDLKTARSQALEFAAVLTLSLNEGRETTLALQEARTRYLSRHHLNKADPLINEKLASELDEFLFRSIANETHLKPILAALKDDRPDRAIPLIDELRLNQNLGERKGAIVNLVRVILEAAQTQSERDALRLQREYLATYLAYLVRHRAHRDGLRQSAINAFWWLKVLCARSDDKIPSWEGIRVVQESKRS